MIYDVVLSRPEDYLSIYQSVCNHACLKCHSWYFAQVPKGVWYSVEELVEEVIKYSEWVTVREPRWRSTMWHASDLCAHCGLCVVKGVRSPYCPRKLRADQVVISPQGWGPARNIISFTGGDLYCQPAYYVSVFKEIKREVPDMWIHIETNGYGLTPRNLELLHVAGLDSIWLDLKAFNRDTYRRLCGTTNEWVLNVPELAKDLGVVLEAVILYIPGLVELGEIRALGELLASVDKGVPTTLLAFFPQHKLSHLREPTYAEMVKAYRVLKEVGLTKVKVGNVGVFCKDEECLDRLVKEIGRENVSL